MSIQLSRATNYSTTLPLLDIEDSHLVLDCLVKKVYKKSFENRPLFITSERALIESKDKYSLAQQEQVEENLVSISVDYKSLRNVMRTSPEHSVSNPVTLILPMNPKIKKKSGLNLELLNAVSKNNSTDCRRLIGIGADVNIKNEEEHSAIDIAILHNAWSTCKVLIDNRAILTTENRRNIVHYLQEAHELIESNQDLFMMPLPNPYFLEVFQKGSFRPLNEVESFQNLDTPQGITLFNIADESLGENYGKIMGVYRKNSDDYNVKIAELAEKQIVLRVRVDDARKLSDVITSIRTIFRDRNRFLLTNWVLMGHANQKAIEVGQSSRLTDQDERMMQEIANHVHPMGSIILQGCSTANGNNNIARIFSRNALGRIVFGSPVDTLSTDFSSIYPSQSSLPRLLPFFTRKLTRYKLIYQVKAYQNNVEVIDAKLEVSDFNSFKNNPFHPLKIKVSVLMSSEHDI